jgi:hypothetical protein
MESPRDTRVRLESGDERSLGELLRELNDHSRRMIHQEVDLAKSELRENLERSKRGGIWLGAATVPGLVGIVCLALALTYALGGPWPPWGAALFWAGVMLLLAAGMVYVGKRHIDRVDAPPTPKTAETLRETGQRLGSN